MNEGTIILVEVLITADDAAFPGTVGAGKGNIANFAAGKNCMVQISNFDIFYLQSI
jgi:hypothetical protein